MMNYYGFRYGMHPFYGGLALTGIIINIFFWILIAFLIVGLIRWFSDSDGEQNGSVGVDAESESALEILKKGYAKGDITKKEYDSMKKDIA